MSHQRAAELLVQLPTEIKTAFLTTGRDPIFPPVPWLDNLEEHFVLLSVPGQDAGLIGDKSTVLVAIWKNEGLPAKLIGFIPPDNSDEMPRAFRNPVPIEAPRDPEKLRQAVVWAATELIYAYRRAGMTHYASHEIKP